MHELSYMVKFIEMAAEAVKDTPYDAIESITVEVGEMTGVLPEYLKKYFPETVKGTPFEGSALEVTSIPVEACCCDCRKKYHPAKNNNYSCPYCKSKAAKIIHGRELNLVNVKCLLK